MAADGEDFQRMTQSGKNNSEQKHGQGQQQRRGGGLGCCLGREADFSAALFTKA
jgi:hypothetical protein